MLKILLCRHTCAFKIKIMQKYVPNYIPAQGKTHQSPSIKHPSKRHRNTDVVLLHRELHLNLSLHIRHAGHWKTSDFGVVYTRYQQRQTKDGMSREALVLWKSDREYNLCFETSLTNFEYRHISGRFKSVCTVQVRHQQIIRRCTYFTLEPA